MAEAANGTACASMQPDATNHPTIKRLHNLISTATYRI